MELLCKKCDVFVGHGGAGVVEPPEDVPTDQLNDICWVCRRTREQVEIDPYGRDIVDPRGTEPLDTRQFGRVETETPGQPSVSDFAADAPGREVSTYVDKAMFDAEAFDEAALAAPRVFLLSATPDPLGAVAAMMMMYEGRVIRDLSEITDDERRHYFDQCFLTTLDTPLEAIDFHFLVEGVTRAHTHQEVRQRTAVFAQESMRFAVKDKIAARPGPLVAGDRSSKRIWDEAIGQIWAAYQTLIANGIPAEEARGLLPHDTLTRLHHKVNLRSLKQELGKRTCTQAQFEWRLWAAGVRRAIADYDRGAALSIRYDGTGTSDFMDCRWQFQYIADSPIFRPICFQTGKCMFKADVDRGCTIRERVDRGAFNEIDDREWATDPTAGWVR